MKQVNTVKLKPAESTFLCTLKKGHPFRIYCHPDRIFMVLASDGTGGPGGVRAVCLASGETVGFAGNSPVSPTSVTIYEE